MDKMEDNLGRHDEKEFLQPNKSDHLAIEYGFIVYTGTIDDIKALIEEERNERADRLL